MAFHKSGHGKMPTAKQFPGRVIPEASALIKGYSNVQKIKQNPNVLFFANTHIHTHKQKK